MSASCGRCGRELTDPESVQRGYGPVCASKIAAHQEQVVEETGDRFLWDPPLHEKLVLKLEDGKVYTNVPHLVHSPHGPGFAWGYGGSGPAELALNLTQYVLNREGFQGQTIEGYEGREYFQRAWRIHQRVKWAFIANAPEEGIEIPYETIHQLVMEQSFALDLR